MMHVPPSVGVHDQRDGPVVDPSYKEHGEVYCEVLWCESAVQYDILDLKTEQHLEGAFSLNKTGTNERVVIKTQSNLRKITKQLAQGNSTKGGNLKKEKKEGR